MPLHHIELWVADSAEALDDWRWLLSSAGYERSAAWAEGETWSDGGVYLTLTGSPHLVDARHDRRRPGVNHLAFVVGGERAVDDIMRSAPAHGWAPLYGERYPHAGGPDHYAGWLENAGGFKVEIVADDG